LRRLALIAALILLAVSPARAAEVVPGSSCAGSVANSFVLSGGPENGGVSNGMFCNGGTNLYTGIINFQSTGNVGIGTASPTAALTVSSDGTSKGQLNLIGTDNTHEISAAFIPAGALSGTNMQWIIGRDYNANAFNLRSWDGTTDVSRLYIDSSGKVGIGTASPSFVLDVWGAATQSGDSRRLAVLQDTASYAAGVGGGIQFRGKYDSAGDLVGFGFVQGVKENGTDGNSSGVLVLGTYPGAGSYTERMRISSTGNVGIGTTSPGTSLDVNGGLTTEPATVNLTADNQVVTVGNRSYIRLASDNATATNRTFCLTAGTSGQYLILEMSSNKGELLNNSTGCGGASVASLIAGATWTADGNDTIELIYNGTNWLQIARAAN
jgi:hypothetical protein